MRTVAMVLGILLAGTFSAGAQSDVVIESFGLPGQITFDRVSNAVSYRVEWSSSAGSVWTNFYAAAYMLDIIPGAGSGPVTAPVPMLYRVVATVTNPPPVPHGMVLIPAGSFSMGGEAAGPVHTVQISTFYMDSHEVSESAWNEVFRWASTNGYDLSVGEAMSFNHPVLPRRWDECVKWCNARSEKEGLQPCYTTNGFVFRTGQDDNVACDWAVNGYRLPTEAEWEKAARGGVADTRFPWTDYTNRISHAKANYYGASCVQWRDYDLSCGQGSHPAFSNSNPFKIWTSPVGYFAPNGYGLFDMAGNLSEWCWDRWNGQPYDTASVTNPTGPTVGMTSETRVMRGGEYESYADHLMVSARDWHPTFVQRPGFRSVRGP